MPQKIASLLTILALVLGLTSPITVLAFSYSIEITSATFSGSTLTISGPADADYVGNEEHQYISFNWGDDTPIEVVVASTFPNYLRGEGKTFTIHDWSRSHPYTSYGAFTVTVKN